MDKRQAIRIAEEYIKTINNLFSIEKAILFGSFARGNFTDDSDIDIAVVLNLEGDFFLTQLELMKLRRNIDLRIEPHVFNSNDFTSSDPVAFEILKYGIEITAAA